MKAVAVPTTSKGGPEPDGDRPSSTPLSSPYSNHGWNFIKTQLSTTQQEIVGPWANSQHDYRNLLSVVKAKRGQSRNEAIDEIIARNEAKPMALHVHAGRGTRNSTQIITHPNGEFDIVRQNEDRTSSYARSSNLQRLVSEKLTPEQIGNIFQHNAGDIQSADMRSLGQLDVQVHRVSTDSKIPEVLEKLAKHKYEKPIYVTGSSEGDFIVDSLVLARFSKLNLADTAQAAPSENREVLSRGFGEGGYTFLHRAFRKHFEGNKNPVIINTGELYLEYSWKPGHKTFMDGVSITRGDPNSETYSLFSEVARSFQVALAFQEGGISIPKETKE